MTVMHAYAPPVAPRRAWLGAGLALAAVAWGANQFAPLVVMYQARLGLSAAVADAMFGFYALGLAPALLAGGRLSDLAGRRSVVMPALLVSFLATCVLMAGGHVPLLLYVGRFLAGVASGLAFGTGAAWVRELSVDAGDTAAGPRRATVAMTAGFAAGPLVAGVCAQWLPLPTETAYLPQLVVLVAAAGPAWRTPDPARTAAASCARIAQTGRPRGLARHFLLVMLPFAPWVFGTAAIALVYLPALAAPRAGRHALLFSALVTGTTALAGIAAQPLARAARRLRPGRTLPASMTVVLAGIGCAAWAADTLTLPLVFLASAVLGIGYGITQFAGLAEVQRIARPEVMGTAIATYQVLSYTGFAFPFLMALAGSQQRLPPPTLLLLLLGVAAMATAWLAVAAIRRPGRPDTGERPSERKTRLVSSGAAHAAITPTGKRRDGPDDGDSDSRGRGDDGDHRGRGDDTDRSGPGPGRDHVHDPDPARPVDQHAPDPRSCRDCRGSSGGRRGAAQPRSSRSPRWGPGERWHVPRGWSSRSRPPRAGWARTP
jgi:hypothetical protein